MDVLGQSALLVSLISIAFGASVLARNVRNKLFIAFFMLCALISAWALTFFLEKMWRTGAFYRAHLLANIWVGPTALAFIGVLNRLQDRTSRFLRDSAFVAAMGLTGALVLGWDKTNSYVRQLVNFLPGVVVIQIIIMMWVDRRLRRGAKRAPKVPTVGIARKNLIYLGALLVLSLSTMDHVPWLGHVLPSIGNLALCAYFFFLSQAITQQRLLNFAAIFTRFLVLISIALILTAFYSLLVAWIENSPALFFLNSFFASFLILMVLDPMRAMVRYFTRRLVTQEHRMLERTLREAQRRLAGVVDPNSLFQEILLTAEQTLRPEWVALYMLRSDGTKYQRARTTGETPHSEPLREVLADNPLLRHCERLRRKEELPIVLEQMLESEIDRSASRAQREQLAGLRESLRALGGNLMIPLFDEDRILGFVALYVPAPPEPWGSNWGLLSMLFPYFEQAAQTLRSMEVYVRQREKERLATIGEMAAGLAHEIRNPLGAIKGAAQYLDPSADRPESKFLGVIVEEVDRLNRVVTQFLDYSKSQTPAFTTVDASQLAGKTVDVLRAAKPEGVELEFRPSREPARASVAAEQIQQVLMNLVQNSFNAIGPRADGRVAVSVEPVDREVFLVVEDNGPGIRRENLDKIFIPFFTTSPSGTGLGLSICQKIVQAHRGRIEVASEEGRYARFSVVLPRV